MKIGEWDGIGHARGLIVRQLGELGAQELAAHVATDERARSRILVATDVGLLDYSWSAKTGEPDATWALRGALVRWPNVRGLRLQTDGEWDPVTERMRSIWRVVAEEPKIELSALEGTEESQGPALIALLAFARACLERTT
jgi:hypothetical protein